MSEYDVVCERLCWTLLHSFWQLAALAVIAGCLSKFCFRERADIAYVVYTAALMLGVIAMPVTYFSIGIVSQSQRSVASATLNTEPLVRPRTTGNEFLSSVHHAEMAPSAAALPTESHAQQNPLSTVVTEPPTQDSVERWRTTLPWLATIYFVGVSVMTSRLLWSLWCVERLRRLAQTVAEGPARIAIDSLCEKWSLSVAPALAHTNQVLTPKVVGLIKPTVLLPTSALSGLSVGELELILAHEMAHLRRHDLWVNLFQRVAESLLFFNPAAWWLSRRISLLREFCCDDQALSSTANDDEPQLRYAQALLQCVQLSEDRIVGVGSLGADGRSPSELRRRVARLLGESITEPLPRLTRGSVALILIGTLLLTGSWLWAAEEPSEPSETAPATQTDGDDAPNETDKAESAEVEANDKESTISNAPATLSGKIVMEDGSPASVEGWMSYDTRYENGNGASGTADQFTDAFEIKVASGTTFLTHHAKGFAPTWTPKITVKAGQHRDDLRLVLRPGASQRVRLVNQGDEPIRGATMLAHPVIHGQSGGINYPKTTDENGEYVFTHLAETQYSIRAEANGYEPIRGEIIDLQPGETIRLSMNEAAKATGVVRRASDRSPLVGASVRLIHEANEKGGDRSFSDSRQYEWWGEEYATTDDSGRFTLDRLTRDGKYLALIEAADGSRGLVESIGAGKDSEILMPKRHDLVVEFRGDIESLPSYGGKRRVKIRQRFRYEPRPNSSVGELLGTSAEIESTETGGRSIVKGLALDLRPNPQEQQVAVSVSGTKLFKTVALNPEGQTLVVFQLPKRETEDDQQDQTANEQSLILKVVDKDGQAIPGLKTRVYDGQNVWRGQSGRYEMEHATTDANGDAVFNGFLKRLPERAGYWIEIFRPEDDKWRIPKRLVGWGNRLSNVSDPLITTVENQKGFTITLTLREECPTELDIIDAETGKRKHFAQLLFKDDRVTDWTLAALQDYIGDPGGDDVSKLGLDFHTTIVPEMSKSKFMATREGYYPVEFVLADLALDRTLQKRVELKPAPKIELTVIDSEGKPCVGAKLEYIGPKARGSVFPVRPSDERGRITMPFPELGRYARYRVTHEKGSTEFSGSRFVTPEPKDLEEPVELLRETIRIPGKPKSSKPVVSAGGSPENSGKIRGEVLGLIQSGDGVRYSITLTTDALQQEKERERRRAKLPDGTESLGPRRPGIVVEDGAAFEFTNVPKGRCTVEAVAIDQKQRKIIGKPVELELDVQAGHTSIVGIALNYPELTHGWLKKTISFREDKPIPLPTNLIWGETVAGLQAAIELKTPNNVKRDPARSPGVPVGTNLNVVFHVKNVSDKEITFVSEEGRQQDLFTVKNDQGNALKLRDTFFTGFPIDKRWRLKPGDIARLTALSCPLDTIQAGGEYTLQYTLRFNSRQQKDEDGNLVFPRPGDYMEELPTGETPFFLQE